MLGLFAATRRCYTYRSSSRSCFGTSACSEEFYGCSFDVLRELSSGRGARRTASARVSISRDAEDGGCSGGRSAAGAGVERRKPGGRVVAAAATVHDVVQRRRRRRRHRRWSSVHHIITSQRTASPPDVRRSFNTGRTTRLGAQTDESFRVIVRKRGCRQVLKCERAENRRNRVGVWEALSLPIR